MSHDGQDEMTRRRPTQARAEATRRAILDATLTLMDSSEPEAISTAQVAEVAGVPVGSVYRYFADRGDILKALAQELMDRVDEPLERMLKAGAPVEELVEAALELVVATTSPADRRLMRVLQLSPELAEIEARSNRRIAKAVAQVLGERNPALSPRTREAAALVLMRAVLSGVEPILQAEDPALRSELHRQTVEMAIAYVRHLGAGDGGPAPLQSSSPA